MTAQSEARQRLDKLAMEVLYAHWDDDHPTGQAIRGIIAALLDDDAILADVVAAAGRDRVLKVAGLEVIGAIEGIVFDEDLPDGYRRETQYRLPVSEGQ